MPEFQLKISFDILKELGDSLAWFLQLGKSDTQYIRDELQDLLGHASQTLKSLVQLTESLYQIKEKDFNEQSFLPVYFHCLQNFADPEAARRTRSHCTDIERDIERIQFKFAKVLRTEWGKLESLNTTFEKFKNTDNDFLMAHEDAMARVNKELNEITVLVSAKKNRQAWKRYNILRTQLLKALTKLQRQLKTMNKAEDHIRRILT